MYGLCGSVCSVCGCAVCVCVGSVRSVFIVCVCGAVYIVCGHVCVWVCKGARGALSVVGPRGGVCI